MKNQTLTILLLACCHPAFSSETPKPFRTIGLDAIKRDPAGCDRNWTPSLNRMIWIDEDHLVGSLSYRCNNADPKARKIQVELAVFDTKGQARGRVDPITSIARGPAGTVVVGHGSEVAMMDTELRTMQTLACPAGPGSCLIFNPWWSSAVFDFALCPSDALKEDCFFYRGMPPDRLSGKSLVPPATPLAIGSRYEELTQSNYGPLRFGALPAWRVGPDELWFFDDRGLLTMRDSKGSTRPIMTERWKQAGCAGDLSVSEPRRFLAVCNGTHFYTDGDLDALFGYSRIALFDVASRSIIARIDGPSGTWATLSPSGRLIATWGGSKIRLYRIS